MPNPVIEHVYVNNTTYDVKDIYAERTENKTSTFADNESNDRYPTALLVKTQLETKVGTSDIATSFGSTPSDAKVASEKLVYDNTNGKEDASNKVSSFENVASADTTKYPTAALVMNGLAAKEDAVNKTSAWSTVPGNTKFPTEKLVYDGLQAQRTIVVTELPTVSSAVATCDYILKNGTSGVLYKVIDGAWAPVGASNAQVLQDLPQSGDVYTDYYVPNSDGVYIHYRWAGGNVGFYEVGADAYSKTQSDAKYEVLDNKRTSFQSTPTDTAYPSEKLVYDSLSSLRTTLEGEINSSTEVVNSLPAVAQADSGKNYVLLQGSGALLYKVINNAWKMIGGAMVSVVDDLPQSGDSFTDYYLSTEDDEVYLHYRWIDTVGNVAGHFYSVGSDAYSKSEIDTKLAEIRSTHSDDKDATDASLAQLGRAINSNTTRIADLEDDQKSYTADLVQNGTTYTYRLLENEEVVSSFNLPVSSGGGGGGGSATNLVVERITQSPVIVTPADRVVISFTFSSTDSDEQTVDGSYILKMGNAVISSGALVQGRNDIDVTDSCSVGSQKFTLTVTDEGGSINVKTWTVQIVDVRLETSFNDRTTNAIGRAVNFTYTPYGAVSKVIHFKMDGIELTSVTTSASGLLQSYTLEARPHGSHLLEVWATATVNNVNVETPHIFKDIIWYNPSLDAPVIGCIYKYTDYGVVEVKQYNMLAIPYVVYDPRTENPTVTLAVDGDVVSEQHLSSAFNTWSYKSDEIASHVLTITCRTTVMTLHVDVTELGYDIHPVTANLEFDFNPTGMTNASANRMWEDANNSSVKLIVSNNFDWNNGGYQTDGNGNQYFCVKSGTRAYISYNLFGTDPKQDGAEFKVIFKTTNVRDKDAVFLTCKSTAANDRAGLEMRTHEAFYYTSSDTLNQPYSEEDIIEFEYNVNSIDTEVADATSFVMTYEDGVAARPLLYSNDAGYLLYQLNPVPITIGSDDCDVHIYRMKAYSSALTDSNILSNFIADARDSDTMIARYERNQIYNENQELTPESVAAACPDLKIIKIDCPHFTNDKADYVKFTNVECIHVNGDPALDNWKFTNGYHAGQGTTSNRYGLAGRNIDIIFGFDGEHQVVSKIPLEDDYVTSLVLGDGTRYTGQNAKVALRRTSVPNTWFNIKVNIASSENANNALLQKRYNDYLPYKTPAQKRDSKVKNSMEFCNCVVFVKETDPDTSAHREFNDTNWHFYAIGNIGDSKKTDNTRVNDPEDLAEFVVEISDNTLPNSTFDTGVYYDENGDITYDPDDAVLNESLTIPSKIVYPITAAQWTGVDGYVEVTEASRLIDKNLPVFYELSSGNYVKTQDASIVSGKTYYLKNYRNTKYASLYEEIYEYNANTGKTNQVSGWDTSFEFRYDMGTKDGETISSAAIKAQQLLSKQVFRNLYEFIITSTDADFVSHFGDWFITESPLYWYLFTERYTMIDNRSKNSFWHYGKTYITEAEAVEFGDDAENYTVDNAAAAINNGYRFDLWNYDDDTALGIDNNGELNMTYGNEDVDYKTPGDPSSGWVFNAAESIFWRRIRQLMGSQLGTMYTSRESLNCWSATSLITEFDNWQNQFPEELWRLDIERKYLRPYYSGNPVAGIAANSDFLQNMMNGRKKYQRRQFERNQEIYIGTKYFGTNQCADSRAISFRCNTPQAAVVRPDYTLRISPYSDMYLSVKYGNTAAQSVRAKAGQEYVFTTSLTSMDDTMILIYCAENIQAINDLSACYIRANNFSVATRLKTLKIGSNVEGYSNPFITTLGITNNALLETLDIRNCPNLTGSLNFSGCPNLVTLLAEGTSVTGVSFASNGKITTAHLPETITSLTLINLNYLSDLALASDQNLIALVSEYGSYNPYPLMMSAINHLQILRILGVDWTFSTTDTLNKIYAMSSSVLSGRATVTGTIRAVEISNYNTAWKDLELVYNPDKLIRQHTVNYKNLDGTLLLAYPVDIGTYPPNPVTAGLIEAPTMASDAQYIYTYSGWDSLTDIVTEPRDIIATYSTVTRKYTVRWFEQAGDDTPLYSTTATYGSEAVYSGTMPTVMANDALGVYQVFTGWDKSTGYIRGNLNVYAQWESASFPSANKELHQMSAAEIYAVSAQRSGSTRYEIKDYFELEHGHDFNFSNVDSELLMQNRFFNGSEYATTSIQLFGENASSFTLAVDYEYLTSCASNGSLINCADPDSGAGFSMTFSANYASPENSYPQIRWTNGDPRRVGKSGQRNIIVLRYIKGSSNLIVYSFNGATSTDVTAYDPQTTYMVCSGTSIPSFEKYLTFGAIRYEEGGSTFYENYATGWIHWAKVWYDDLGDANCRLLAAWPHEKTKMEYAGERRQLLSTSNGLYADSSFFANDLLPLTFQYSGDSYVTTTWEGSQLQEFYENRIYKGLPYKWQSVIKAVKVDTARQNGQFKTITSINHLYAPAYVEVYNITTDSQYKEEHGEGFIEGLFGAVNTYNMTTRWAGIPVEDRNNSSDGRRVISSASDPTYTGGYACQDGDIWYRTTSPRWWMFVSAETASKHSIIGTRQLYDISDSSLVIEAYSGGYWVRCEGWWTRSPDENTNASFRFRYSWADSFSNQSYYLKSGILIGLSI